MVQTNPKDVGQSQKESTSGDYQKAVELAETGRYEEALGFIQEYLSSAPKDAEALNDAGSILHCMGYSQEAINHLVKARNLLPDSAEITWNLSETYLAAGQAEKAAELFDEMQRMGILNADVLNRTADVLLNTGNLADAVKMLERSLEISPNQEILKPIIEVIRRKMTDACTGDYMKQDSCSKKVESI
jgi:pentatricopeptide repeat protein